MGFDIAYFTNAKPIELPYDVKDAAAWSRENCAIQYYTLEGQEARLEGLPAGWVTADFVDGFRAGSYSGYNRWRRLLSKSVLGADADEVWENPRRFDGKPFVELIDFADNEGCIGPIISAKLAKDFQGQRNAFAKADGVEEYDLSLYDNWAKAFVTVAGTGIILFQ